VHGPPDDIEYPFPQFRIVDSRDRFWRGRRLIARVEFNKRIGPEPVKVEIDSPRVLLT
jgi:hypothetical protein